MSDELKHIADLLKSGASMLSEACPVCNTPLFKKDGRIFCPKCNKPVVIVRAPEDENRLTASMALANLENTVLQRLVEASNALKVGGDIKDMIKISSAISLWLEIVEKIRKLR